MNNTTILYMYSTVLLVHLFLMIHIYSEINTVEIYLFQKEERMFWKILVCNLFQWVSIHLFQEFLVGFQGEVQRVVMWTFRFFFLSRENKSSVGPIVNTFLSWTHDWALHSLIIVSFLDMLAGVITSYQREAISTAANRKFFRIQLY